MKFVEAELTKILKKAGIKDHIDFDMPPNPEMGDVSFPIFYHAGKGGNPVAFAKELAEKIDVSGSDLVSDARAVGPYVNFFLDTGVLVELVIKDISRQGEKYGSNNIGKGKKIMIEYPSQNTHKEFHVGHLRNVSIGNTLVQLYRKSGYTVAPVNYINDFGTHVVACLWGILNTHKGKLPKKDLHRWLGQTYAESNQKISNSDDLKREANELQIKLEGKDKEIWDLYVKTRDVSLEAFDALQSELGVEHKKVFLESAVKDKGQKIVDELLKKKIAKQGDGGAIIIDLEKEKLGVALLRKSTGAGVYLTSDLALANEKFKNSDIEESINLTGLEQDYYFKQLFRVLELSGFKHKMTHIGHGLVSLAGGKMSSRTGQVVLYEDMRDQIFEKLKQETAKRHEDWSKTKIEKTASTLTQAALKLTMQKHEVSKNIVFDLEEATSFEGYSAPYILYVVARINRLLEKSGEQKSTKNEVSVLQEPEEKSLAIMLAMFPDIIQKAQDQYNPSVIAKYCFDLSKAFNDFYAKHKIVNSEDEAQRGARLELCKAVRSVLQNALSILTIETVEEM